MLEFNIEEKKSWKEIEGLSEEHEFDPTAFLNGNDVRDCKITQQQVYIVAKYAKSLEREIQLLLERIEELEVRLKKLEGA